jgi:hypothetical protein
MRRLVRDHSCRLWAFGAFLVIWLEGPGLGRAQASSRRSSAPTGKRWSASRGRAHDWQGMGAGRRRGVGATDGAATGCLGPVLVFRGGSGSRVPLGRGLGGVAPMGRPLGLAKAPCSRERSWRMGWVLRTWPPEEIFTRVMAAAPSFAPTPRRLSGARARTGPSLSPGPGSRRIGVGRRSRPAGCQSRLGRPSLPGRPVGRCRSARHER